MKTIRLTLSYFRHNLMSAMAYRGAFLLQALGMVLNDAMLLFFWAILFTRFPSLRGWTMNEVLVLYGTVAFAFGLTNVVCGNAFGLARIITSGDLDYYLVLPAAPLTHLLVARMSASAWGDIGFGVIVFLVFSPHPWIGLPLFLLLGAAAAVVLTSFAVLVGSLTFWVGNADNLATQAINAVVTFGTYPIDIFPGPVQLLLYTLIPAAFVGSLPAGLLSDLRWERLLLLAAVAAGLALLARCTFYRGLRRYESGNLVTVRG